MPSGDPSEREDLGDVLVDKPSDRRAVHVRRGDLGPLPPANGLGGDSEGVGEAFACVAEQGTGGRDVGGPGTARLGDDVVVSDDYNTEREWHVSIMRHV